MRCGDRGRGGAGCTLSGLEPQCAHWPTEEFFAKATVSQVVACLDAGMDLAAVDDPYSGQTALHAAAKASSDPRVIEILLEAGLDVDVLDGFEHTPLQRSVDVIGRGAVAVIEALLDAGADPNVRSGSGWTLLHSAAYEAQDAGIIKALIAGGAQLDVGTAAMIPDDAGGETPLHLAVRSGAAPAAVETLLAAGADVSALDGYGWTPMHGLQKAEAEVVELLLNAGGAVDSRGGGRATVLQHAAGAEPAVIRRLIEAGADVHARDQNGETALHSIAEASKGAAAVGLLLAAGADPLVRDRLDATPLHAAVRGNGSPSLLRALLDAGAALEARDYDGRTPLFYAAQNVPNPEAFRTLLALGAEVDAVDDEGKTLLHAAAFGDNLTAVEALLAGGAEVDARDSQGETPLHAAAAGSGWLSWDIESWIGGEYAIYGETTVVETLLAAGAEVNARDSRGETPLHDAASYNRNPVVLELLLEAGADAEARDDTGRTPLDLARRLSPREMIEILSVHPFPVRLVESSAEDLAKFQDCPTCPQMVVLPAGKFRMGCIDEAYACQSSDRLPSHNVDVASFAISRFEVTRGQFKAFAAATGHPSEGCEFEEGSWRKQGWQSDDHPVVCVGWSDAQAYVRWLGGETGFAYRLPTEAEWEYAARGGMTTRFYWGYRASDLCRYENADGLDCDDPWDRTAPVGSFRPNGFGLYDIVGNVSEWVQDCWHDSYEDAPNDGSAWLRGGACDRRVVRGGNWAPALPQYFASSDREGKEVGFRWYRMGFRVARDLNLPQVSQPEKPRLSSN